ncbi:MAG: ribosome biogenesis protein [Euryarchaeota archaeon]|nr:ribosome biogenesis protein [Euryarchaeota archaeon]
MVRTRLQRCTSCGEYGLGARCEKCGSAMAAVSPMKYSPEDPQGARRRKRMDVGSDEWLESLPTTRNEESEEE